MKRRTAIIISSAVIVLIAAACIVAAVAGNEKIDVRVIDEENGEYMLINVPADYSFDIEAGDDQSRLKKKDFFVYDIYGKKINAKKASSGSNMRIKAPDGGYDKGGVYTLDLQGKAKFLDEDYSEAAKITFIVEQKETAKLAYQDGVIELEHGSVELNDKKLTLEGKYKTGDIIVTDTDGDDIDEVYKLKGVVRKNGKTTASFEDPAADEVYKDIDIFYYDDVDLRRADIDEEAFLGVIEETGMLGAFTDEVYAADSSNITITSKKGKGSLYEFTALLKDPADESRQLEISFGISDKALVKYDKKIAIVDNNLQLTSGLEFSVKGKGSKKTESNIRKALENYKAADGGASEAGDYDVPLVPIKIPVIGPVNVYIDLGLTANIEFSAEFNAGVDTSLTFSQGIIFDAKEREVKKTYADITGDIDAHIMVSGKLGAFAGAYVKGGLDIPLLLDLGIDAKGGPYLDGEGCFIVKGIPKDIKSSGYYRLEIGIMFNSNARIKALLFDEKSIPIADKKKPLYQLSKYLQLKETDLHDTYYLIDDKIEIGKINATYHNIIEDKDVAEELSEYSLYIDDEKADVENGVITSAVSEGTHKFKLTWKYEGDKYEVEKEVEVSDFDPWGYFKKLDRLGKSGDEIVHEYGSKLKYLGDIIYDGYSDDTLMNYRQMDVCGKVYNIKGTQIAYSFGDNPYCSTMSGTAKELFGLNSSINISDLMSRLNVQIGDKKTYSIILPLDISKCFWWSIVSDETVTVDGVKYVYLIKVFPKGLESVYYYNGESMNVPYVVPLNDIRKYYGGITDKSYIVDDDTMITISLLNREYVYIDFE